jgi:Spy/CpxP family protein refolding chaperone
MKKKTTLKKTMLTLLCTGALVFTSTAALAQPTEVGGGEAPWRMKRAKRFERRMELFKAKLGLSEAQLAQLKTIRSDARARTKTYRQQLRPLRQKMRALLQAEVINEAQVVALHQKVRSLRQILAQERLNSRLAVMRVLNKDQRAKLFELRSKRKGRGMHKRHRRGRLL